MKSLDKNVVGNTISKKTLRKQYLLSVLLSIGITGTLIGAGYLIDLWQGTTFTYILIGFVISGPLSVWANYSLIKKKFINPLDDFGRPRTK
jgi:F0F1-type ATP synthase assembly protein I